MNNEISFLIAQLKDAFEGDPWFGKPGWKLLEEVSEDIAFEKPNGQHSIAELVWHMTNWKAFAVHCLRPQNGRSLYYFEENDWKDLDHSDKSLFQTGLNQLQKTQAEFLNILQEQQDSILDQSVPEKAYSYRKLLNGVLQHDIYHLGQIAYIRKLLANK